MFQDARETMGSRSLSMLESQVHDLDLTKVRMGKSNELICKMF